MLWLKTMTLVFFFFLIFVTFWKLSIEDKYIIPRIWYSRKCMLLYHFLIPCIVIHIGKLPIEWAIVFQFDGLSTDINLVCGCALMVVWSATFPKLSLVSSNVIVMLASKLVSTVVLRNFTIVICSLLFLRHENTFLSYKN